MAHEQRQDADQGTIGRPLRRFFVALQHRRVRAVAHLLTGTSATVALSLVSIALAARALGPQQYGVLALILTLGQASERLLSFQSWQPLIRYGATLDSDGERDDLRSLFKFGLLLDGLGSSAAWIVASGCAIGAHYVLGIPWPATELALVYVFSLLFNLNGTSTAIFRLSGRFRIVAHLQILNAALRLAASVFAFLMGSGLTGFVLVWMATQISGSLLNIGFGLRLLAHRGIKRLLAANITDMTQRFPDLWRFTWGANVSLTIWASAQQLDTLIVGWLADPASAGMFHIAKRVSRVVQQVGSQVEAVVYPDLSRLWAAGQRSAFVRLVYPDRGHSGDVRSLLFRRDVPTRRLGHRAYRRSALRRSRASADGTDLRGRAHHQRRREPRRPARHGAATCDPANCAGGRPHLLLPGRTTDLSERRHGREHGACPVRDRMARRADLVAPQGPPRSSSHTYRRAGGDLIPQGAAQKRGASVSRDAPLPHIC